MIVMKFKEMLGKNCVEGKELKILKSPAGCYMGTTEYDKEFDCDFPNCRLSSSYYKSEIDLEESEIEIRDCVENNHCSDGQGCLGRIGG